MLLEMALDELALKLRADPTLPADPMNITEASSEALRDDIAVWLPPKHCAFNGCAWEGDEEE